MSMLQLPQWETKITIQECFDLELIYYLPDTKVVRSSQNVLNYSFFSLWWTVLNLGPAWLANFCACAAKTQKILK